MRIPKYVINGTFRIADADVVEFMRSSNVMSVETRKEAGCVFYHMGRDIADPALFHLAEAWTDREAIEAHFGTPHFKLAMREVAAITVEHVTMRRYGVDGEEDLSGFTSQ